MTVEDYLLDLTPSRMSEYTRIADIVKAMIPDSEVTITYDIPTWKYKGKYVLYFAAYKSHMSIYPASLDLLEELRGKLGDFQVTTGTKKSAGTIQFSSDNPVPEIVIKEIVSRRMMKIDGK